MLFAAENAVGVPEIPTRMCSAAGRREANGRMANVLRVCLAHSHTRGSWARGIFVRVLGRGGVAAGSSLLILWWSTELGVSVGLL